MYQISRNSITFELPSKAICNTFSLIPKIGKVKVTTDSRLFSIEYENVGEVLAYLTHLELYTLFACNILLDINSVKHSTFLRVYNDLAEIYTIIRKEFGT